MKASFDRSPMALRDAVVLLLEENVILALDLAMMLEEAGASVCGSGAYTFSMSRLAQDLPVDIAIVGCDIHGRTSTHLAKELEDRGIPYVFYVVRNPDAEDTLGSNPDAIVQRPCAEADILDGVSAAIAGKRSAQSRHLPRYNP